MKIQNLLKKLVLMVSAAAAILSAVGPTSTAQATADYGPAIWRPAPSGRWYTTGYGKKFYVIHDMEGYYLSTISYLQGNNTSVSVGYCSSGKSDYAGDAPGGEITQMVLDAYYSWTSACWNTRSMSTEHEGFAANPAWYTPAMYDASAALTKSKAEKYGFAKDRNHIVGHGEKATPGWPAWASANLGIDPYCNNHTDPGPYWDWTGFMAKINGSGSGLTTKPSLAWMSGGRMVMFAVGTDTAIWHNWQTSAGGPWNGWVSLGGSGFSDCQGMVESDGRLVVYGIGQGGALWQRWQTSVGGNWSAWTSIGGALYQFNVVRQTNGLPIAFAISTGGSVWSSYQPSAGASWTAWVALGGSGAASGFSKVQGYLGSDNRIYCFGIGNGSELWQIWQTGPGSPNGAWSAWTGLGNALTDFEVIKGSNGLPVAFGVTTSGNVTHNWQPSAGASWNGWGSLGGSGFARIDALKKSNGVMVVFGIGGAGEVWHNWQTSAGGPWNGWSSLGSTVTSLTADVTSSDALLFFGRGTDSAMWHRWQSASGGTWSAWANLGGSLK